MKKVIFAFALLTGAMFVSCGNSTKQSTDNVDTVHVDSLVTDTTSVDSANVD